MKKSLKIILISACIISLIGTGCGTANDQSGKRESAETTIERSLYEDIWETESTTTVTTVTSESTTTKSEMSASTTKSETSMSLTEETEQSETEKISQMYVLNINTMKIHYPDCSSVKDISSNNYAETYDYAEAISSGYKPCKRCNPEE